AINSNGMLMDGASYLEVGGHGGSGNDRIFFNYDGELDGLIDMTLDGESGNDHIEAAMNLRAGSTGLVGRLHLASNFDPMAKVDGGSGDDSLSFKIFDHSNGQADINPVIRGRLATDLTSLLCHDV